MLHVTCTLRNHRIFSAGTRWKSCAKLCQCETGHVMERNWPPSALLITLCRFPNQANRLNFNPISVIAVNEGVNWLLEVQALLVDPKTSIKLLLYHLKLSFLTNKQSKLQSQSPTYIYTYPFANMSFKSALSATAFAAALRGAFADPFAFCKDNTCGDCPVSVTNTGTGFPNCVVYNTADIFTNQGFGGSPGG